MADLILVLFLVVLIYGAIWFNLAQMFITDWRVSITGDYPAGF